MGALYALVLLAGPPGAVERPIHRFQADLMGTTFHIAIADEVSPAVAQAAAGKAFTEVARVEAKTSEWRTDSEISAINRAAGEASVTVSVETITLVQRALRLAAASEGAFDITWAALRGLWSFHPDHPRRPTDAALAAALTKVDYQRVLVDAEAKTVRLRDRGMALGLGAIAKGYGVDRALLVLKQAGLAHALVDGGGDLAVMGRPATSRPWTVGVQHPRGGPLLAQLPVEAGAVVTSGDYERFFEADGRRYHHLLDLRTGRPARASVAVTVRAPEATLADALSTAAFVLGPKRGLALIARYPGVDVALFTPDGRVVTSPGFRAHFPPRWDGR